MYNAALFSLFTNRFSLLRLLPRLCSSKWKNASDEAKAKGLGGNLKGDGGQTGGVLVVGQGGAPTMFTYKQVRSKTGLFLASIGPFQFCEVFSFFFKVICFSLLRGSM